MHTTVDRRLIVCAADALIYFTVGIIRHIDVIIISAYYVFDDKKHWTVKFSILCFTMITIILRRLGVCIIRQRAESKRRQEADYATTRDSDGVEGLASVRACELDDGRR